MDVDNEKSPTCYQGDSMSFGSQATSGRAVVNSMPIVTFLTQAENQLIWVVKFQH